jgi:hypothetical protein
MVAVGTAVMVTCVVTATAAQPDKAGIVYVTVYVPAVLVDGVIAPDEELMLNPPEELYTPPV